MLDYMVCPIERRGNVARWEGTYGDGVGIWQTGSIQHWAKKLNDGDCI